MQFAYQSYDPESLFTEEQAAQFLQLSARTLQAWRVRGGGLFEHLDSRSLTLKSGRIRTVAIPPRAPSF
jgi:hypothetical protein